MAAVFKSIRIATIGTTDTTIHTAATNMLVLSILLANSHYGTLPVSVWIMRGANRIDIANSFRVEADRHGELLANKITLETGDVLHALCPISGKFNGMISGYEDV